LTQAALPPSPYWRLLNDLDAILDADFPLPERLQRVNQILLGLPEVDAVWSLVLGPLPHLACGLLSAPTSMAPTAPIQLTDQCQCTLAWPPALDTLLGEAAAQRGPLFNLPAPSSPIDADLGDALFNSFDLSPVAVLPFMVENQGWGGLVLGQKNRQERAIPPDAQQFFTFAARQLAKKLHQLFLLSRYQEQLAEMERRTAEMQTLNRLSEMMGSTVDLKQIAGAAITMLPRILTHDVYAVVIHDEAGAIVGLAVPSNFQATEKIKRQVFSAFLELTDQTDIEIISTRILPSDKPVDKNWQAAASLTLPLITRQGTQGLIFSASGHPAPLPDNFLRIFSLVAAQISIAIENARLFHQVEQERARLAAILTSSTDAVLVVDRKERIVLDNPAARQILNAAESQIGRRLNQATTLDSLINLFRSAIRSGSTTGEVLLPDGRTFFANLSPVAVEGGGVIGWVATMQDVSHFKELNELKNEFVNTVSHDLRSPLSGILMAAKLLEENNSLNGDQLEMLRIIDRRVNSMSQLIDDLLDVGRIEAGMDMELEPCRVSTIIMEVVNSLLPQAEAKEISLNTHLVPHLPLLQSNRHRLQQVVHNLVANAIKYTPPHGRVQVTAFTVPNEVHLKVIDTGYGIPLADQPHIFEKFYRIKGEHVVNIKGTGLGLAIVKSIVDKLNGRVWVESAFGQGSTFTVSLPIAATHRH
jgi:PAS domain S-box-containing protein